LFPLPSKKGRTMQALSTGRQLSLAVLMLLASPSTAWASGATFAIQGEGITLGKAKETHQDGKPLPPQFSARAELGKPFTLTAQGMVLPRGGKAQPGEPDSGAWSFDKKSFKRLRAGRKRPTRPRSSFGWSRPPWAGRASASSAESWAATTRSTSWSRSLPQETVRDGPGGAKRCCQVGEFGVA